MSQPAILPNHQIGQRKSNSKHALLDFVMSSFHSCAANRAMKRLNVPHPMMPKFQPQPAINNKANSATARVQRTNVPKPKENQNAKKNLIYGKIMPSANP